MADVKCIAPTRIGGTEIEYAQGMRAGSWLFFTGHMATDFEHGLAAMVAGKPGLPLGSPPRYRREGSRGTLGLQHCSNDPLAMEEDGNDRREVYRSDANRRQIGRAHV